MTLSYYEIQQIKAIAKNFQIANGEITHVIQINSGRINSSYKVTVTNDTDTYSYMLQKINTHVFPNVKDVMNNAILVTNHLRAKGMETLEYIYTIFGEPIFIDNGDYYRMTKFIHAEIFQNITRPQDMFNLGFAVGQFAVGLSDFDASKLVDPIPNFHNTRVRYENLLISAVNNSLYHDTPFNKVEERVSKAAQEIAFVNENRENFGIIVDAITRGDIPLRVTHNDTKLNNVLFDRKTNIPRCLIDLDTVMQGTILYDIADAIRSGANICTEDDESTINSRVDTALVIQFLKGFAKGAPNMLTEKEKELLPTAIMLMPIELGMRYLTDYFDGDVYFSVTNPTDNLKRARIQFALAKDIMEHIKDIERIVKNRMEEKDFEIE